MNATFRSGGARFSFAVGLSGELGVKVPIRRLPLVVGGPAVTEGEVVGVADDRGALLSALRGFAAALAGEIEALERLEGFEVDVEAGLREVCELTGGEHHELWFDGESGGFGLYVQGFPQGWWGESLESVFGAALSDLRGRFGVAVGV